VEIPSVSVRWLVVCLALMAGIAGCGKKGPLYLPDQPPAKKEARPTP
jgi:predicted small lipoprotein YifL